MKHVMRGFVGIVLIVVITLAYLTIQNRNVKESEMESSLTAAVDGAVEQMSMQGKYTVDEADELVADFTALLVEQLNVSGTEEQTTEDGTHIEKADADENFKIKVDVAGIDAKKGFLAVHITEEFTHPNGKIGKYETDAALVLEQEENKAVHQIAYVIPENIRVEAQNANVAIPGEYKTYLLEEGELFKTPSNPPDFGGKHFVAWSDEDGAIHTTAELVTMKVEKSLTLSAVYN